MGPVPKKPKKSQNLRIQNLINQLPFWDRLSFYGTEGTDNSKSGKYSMSLETESESSFLTSTPKSDNRCEECKNTSQCVDCFVVQTLGGHGNIRKLFY